MEIWRTRTSEPPKLLSGRNIWIAVAIHAAVFVVFWTFAVVRFTPKETVIPIDLTVVVEENLDGNEDEPPPLEKPPPEPPKPPPKPQPKPEPKVEPPKADQKVDAVETVKEKPKPKKKEPEKKTEPEKKVEPPKKPEPPKKTKQELLEEKLKAIRKEAKDTKRTAKPQPNGKTDKKTLSDAEIQKLLNQGYKPGRTTNLAANEEQLCLSLIKRAFESKWDKPPWSDTLKPIVVRCWFGSGGRLVNYRLIQSSGDGSADATISTAAKLVRAVPGLTAGFIDKYKGEGIDVRFTVTPK